MAAPTDGLSGVDVDRGAAAGTGHRLLDFHREAAFAQDAPYLVLQIPPVGGGVVVIVIEVDLADVLAGAPFNDGVRVNDDSNDNEMNDEKAAA
jgi:hypothetical protein